MYLEIGIIALLFGLIVNLCGSVWWAGNMNSRVKSLEDKVAAVASFPERLARVETVMQTLVTTSQQTSANVSTVKDFLIAQGHHENSRLKQLVDGEGKEIL